MEMWRHWSISNINNFLLYSVFLCTCEMCVCILAANPLSFSSSVSSSLIVLFVVRLNVHWVEAICWVYGAAWQAELRIYFIVRYNDDNIPIKWNWISFVCSPSSSSFICSLFTWYPNITDVRCHRHNATFYKSLSFPLSIWMAQPQPRHVFRVPPQ